MSKLKPISRIKYKKVDEFGFIKSEWLQSPSGLIRVNIDTMSMMFTISRPNGAIIFRSDTMTSMHYIRIRARREVIKLGVLFSKIMLNKRILYGSRNIIK